jgi:hypothetical protein
VKEHRAAFGRLLERGVSFGGWPWFACKQQFSQSNGEPQDSSEFERDHACLPLDGELLQLENPE